jgi:hypothetical protein
MKSHHLTGCLDIKYVKTSVRKHQVVLWISGSGSCFTVNISPAKKCEAATTGWHWPLANLVKVEKGNVSFPCLTQHKTYEIQMSLSRGASFF